MDGAVIKRSAHCALPTVVCKVYTVQCAHCAMCILYNLHTVQSAQLCKVHNCAEHCAQLQMLKTGGLELFLD